MGQTIHAVKVRDKPLLLLLLQQSSAEILLDLFSKLILGLILLIQWDLQMTCLSTSLETLKDLCQFFMDNYDIKAMPCYCILPLNH